LSDQFQDALWQFVREFRVTLKCTPVRMVVYVAEDEQHPAMDISLREIDRAICQQALNPPPPPEGPAERKK
jgi:hypothetical protein